MRQSTAIITDFTQGSIPKKMLRFSVPFMLSNALQVLYAIVDMIVVGKFVGSAGLSAVSTASSVFTFMTMLCLGFSTGGQVYISQLIGANKRDKLNAAIGTLFSLITIIGVIMTAVGLIFKAPALTLMNTPAESYDMALDYMLVCSIGVIFSYGYNMVSAVLRGMGDSKHPFIFIAIAAFINLLLDLLFVAVFKCGVAGAAVATILGQAFSFIYALIFLYKRKSEFGFDFKLKSLKPDKEVCSKLISLGVPFALQSCAINISMLFVNSLVNSLGVNASAVFGVGLKIDDIINKVTQAFSFATSAMVGQNIAAGEIKRTRRTVYCSWLFAAAAYAVFTVIYLTQSQMLFSLFTDDAGVIALAPVFVSAFVLSFPAMVIMRGANGFIQGIGNAKLGLALALFDGFFLRIACSYLFGTVFNMGLYGFFLGFAIAPYGTALPGMLYFFSKKWERRRLI